eukprot:gnl/Ergobibamus_cyprinoides/4534.p2 GENE.gnl/Ergobibamus_cyprinoides/4534~~gnl/Ergobibamus_cyprinoides/4534.p2  ORF type:complete len:121 (-),score=32.02 gnl/Ergobibamus_cyprinoides/4534:59-421(-)
MPQGHPGGRGVRWPLAHCRLLPLHLPRAHRRHGPAVTRSEGGRRLWFLAYLPLDPRRKAEGLNPLQLDTAEATIPLAQYLDRESRFTQLARVNPTEAARQRELLQATIDETLKTLHTMAL